MAKGFIIGGGGSILDPIGNKTTPFYIDSNENPQACTPYEEAIVFAANNLYDSTGKAYSAGSSEIPVYFLNGIPVAVTQNLATNIKCSWSTDKIYVTGIPSISNNKAALYANQSVYMQNKVLYNAAWNDYAEFLPTEEELSAGTCVIWNGHALAKSTHRLQKLPYIVSDTFGSALGDAANSLPVVVAGRVLAKTAEQLNPGDTVCSAPNGTVSKMSRIEIILFPDRVLGQVLEIPEYDTWNDVAVNSRVWIKIK